MKLMTYIGLLEIKKPEKGFKERGNIVNGRTSFAFQVVSNKAKGEMDGRCEKVSLSLFLLCGHIQMALRAVMQN